MASMLVTAATVAATPAGVGANDYLSGGVASLNPRLMADIRSG